MREREKRQEELPADAPQQLTIPTAVPTAVAVRDLFDANARHYDRVNRIITFGQDARWRRWAARQAVEGAAARQAGAGAAGAPRKILDACFPIWYKIFPVYWGIAKR